jgi:hypothetical protein
MTQDLLDQLLSLDNLSLAEIERHLDAGNIEIAMRSGKWWQVRRNGRTQCWKTRPNEFRIPIKAGLYVYDALTHHGNPFCRLRNVSG